MMKFLLPILACLVICASPAKRATEPQQKAFLTPTNQQRIYRRSFTADYIVSRIINGDTLKTPLSKNGAQECARLTPDCEKVVFVRNNNLFVTTLATGEEKQITSDGVTNKIINGKPDWVYEEEFGLKTFFDISPDSKVIAWVRTDETKVRTFSFPWYQGTNPEKSEYALYPGTYEYKYPKAGEENSKVGVCVHNLETGISQQITLPLDHDGYIPRITFTEHSDKLAITTLNRHQNRFEVYIADLTKGETNRILQLTTKQYFREDLYGHFSFKNDKFVLLNDCDGYNHLYLYDINGQLIRQLTYGDFDVAEYYGCNSAGTTFYYSSHELSPLELNAYSIDLKGKKKCLTPERGWHKVTFSNDFKDFTDEYSTINSTPIVIRRNGKKIVAEMPQPTIEYPAELFSFTTSEGVTLNGWMVRPKDDGKKHPVIMYQYSGPGSQEVKNSWNVGFYNGLEWERKMAAKGYVVACVDGRGTGSRGADFLKCTYLTMGDKESKDQVEAAIWLGNQPYIDKDRIAIWGWSFGGFNTLLSMAEGRPVFKCGVAIAPVTDWRYYDSIYTERFMRTPQENPDGYDISPIHRYKNLHGKLLIMHGLADDNVHFQNTAEYVEKLVQEGIQFEMQTYTNRNHSIYGGKTRDHLLTRLETFLETNL